MCWSSVLQCYVAFPAHCLVSNRASVDVPKSTQQKASHAPAWKRVCRRALLEESRLGRQASCGTSHHLFRSTAETLTRLSPFVSRTAFIKQKEFIHLQFPAQGDGPHHFASNTGMPLGRTIHQLCVPYKETGLVSNYRATVVQVDGPHHFASNTGTPLGRTLVRDRLLAARGWQVRLWHIEHPTPVLLPAHALLPLPDAAAQCQRAPASPRSFWAHGSSRQWPRRCTVWHHDAFRPPSSRLRAQVVSISASDWGELAAGRDKAEYLALRLCRAGVPPERFGAVGPASELLAAADTTSGPGTEPPTAASAASPTIEPPTTAAAADGSS